MISLHGQNFIVITGHESVKQWKKIWCHVSWEMFSLHFKNRRSEWARQNMWDWESVAIATGFIFPKLIQLYQSALQFPKSISLGFIEGTEMKEKWVFNGRTAPPKALSLLSFYSNSQSHDIQICGLFLSTAPSLCLLFVWTRVHADREMRFKIFSDLHCFSIYYCLPSSLLLSVLPTAAMCGFLFDSSCQSDSFK